MDADEIAGDISVLSKERNVQLPVIETSILGASVLSHQELMSNIKKKVSSNVQLNFMESKMLKSKQKSVLKASKEPPAGMTVRVDSDGGKPCTPDMNEPNKLDETLKFEQ